MRPARFAGRHVISTALENALPRRAEAVNGAFIIIIGCLFIGMFLSFAYQGIRVWAVLGAYQTQYATWHERARANVAAVASGGTTTDDTAATGGVQAVAAALGHVAVRSLPVC